MDLKLSISVSLVAAVIAAELISFVYYALIHRHDLGDRYMVSGIICDVILAYLIQHITGNFWRVYKWEDAAILSAWMTLFFACLTAPHVVHKLDGYVTKRFFINVLHKFAMIFAMCMAMLLIKD